jgi:hypothetical protein
MIKISKINLLCFDKSQILTDCLQRLYKQFVEIGGLLKL